jgi:alkylation response protein AidB-like acyl-CoA dehydrogenase
MLLGYHILWSQIADVVGSAAQADRFHRLWVENNYYIGGAVNPRDNDLKISDNGETLSFSGFKHFTTGAAISDLIVLEGSVESGEHIFAAVPTRQAGVQFAYNWNNIGLRLTESGSATITDVRVPWVDALGWDAESKTPDPAILGVPYATLVLPAIQLVFSNFYLGIALGALATAKSYTTTTTRPWPYGGDVSAALRPRRQR